MRLHRDDDGTMFECEDDALNPDGTVRDGFTIRVPMMFRDHNRAIIDAQRKKKKVVGRDPAGRVVEEFEEEDALRFSDGGSNVPVGSRPGFITDATGNGERIRWQAYCASVRELNDAWKQDAPPVGAEASVGSPGHREGDACTVRAGGVGEGGPGRLVRVGDWLVCKPVSARTDAAPHDPRAPVSVSDSQRIRDAAYQQMCDEMQNAWRTPR